MSAFGRRAAPLALVALLAACGTAIPPATSRASGAPIPTLTAVPGAPSATAAATLPATTETEFGRIWDALPPGFPRLSGAKPADQPGPASAIFGILVGDAKAASQTMRDELRAAGWTVDVGSPLEDGSIVLEAQGAAAGCRAEIRFTPVGGSVIMTVLLGADCPFS